MAGTVGGKANWRRERILELLEEGPLLTYQIGARLRIGGAFLDAALLKLVLWDKIEFTLTTRGGVLWALKKKEAVPAAQEPAKATPPLEAPAAAPVAALDLDGNPLPPGMRLPTMVEAVNAFKEMKELEARGPGLGLEPRIEALRAIVVREPMPVGDGQNG